MAQEGGASQCGGFRIHSQIGSLFTGLVTHRFSASLSLSTGCVNLQDLSTQLVFVTAWWFQNDHSFHMLSVRHVALTYKGKEKKNLCVSVCVFVLENILFWKGRIVLCILLLLLILSLVFHYHLHYAFVGLGRGSAVVGGEDILAFVRQEKEAASSLGLPPKTSAASMPLCAYHGDYTVNPYSRRWRNRCHLLIRNQAGHVTGETCDLETAFLPSWEQYNLPQSALWPQELYPIYMQNALSLSQEISSHQGTEATFYCQHAGFDPCFEAIPQINNHLLSEASHAFIYPQNSNLKATSSFVISSLCNIISL